MNTDEARKLLTDRHSRIHDASGMTYIGLSLEDAEAIAGLIVALVALTELPVTVEPTPEAEYAEPAGKGRRHRIWTDHGREEGRSEEGA